MTPAAGKGGHYGLAPHVPIQGCSTASSTYGVESWIPAESGGVRSSKATKSEEGKAAVAAVRAGLGRSVHDCRKRLFGIVSAISRDPPLIFFESF